MKTIRLFFSSLNLQKDNLLMMLMLYLALPLAVSFFMLFIFTGAEQEASKMKLSVYFVDEEKTELSSQYLDTIRQMDWVEEKDEGDAAYKITLEKGFESLLQGEEGANAQIESLTGGSTGRNLLQSLMENVGLEYQRALSLQKAGEFVDFGQLFENKTLKSDADENIVVVKQQVVDGYLSYVFFMFAMAIPAGEIQLRKIGLNKRIYSTPTKKSSFLISDVLVFFCLGFATSLMYMLIHRFAGNAYQTNFVLFALVAGIFCLLFMSVFVLVNNLIPNPQITTFIFMVPMLIQIMGVSTAPMAQEEEASRFVKLMDQFRIDKLLQSQFSSIREGTFSGNQWMQLAILLAISLSCIALGCFVLNRRKEIVG